MEKFTGYLPQIIKFLDDLKDNNNKDWFDEHRKFYEKEIRDRSKMLIKDMSVEFMKEGLPFIADPKKSLFRINRDIRFSKNKEPYKTNIGLFFPFSLEHTGKKPINVLGMYMHLSPEGNFVGGGIHTPPSDIMQQIREKLAEDWKELEALYEDENFKKEFPRRRNDEKLKRMPAGFNKDHPASEYLRMKSFLVSSSFSFEIANTSELKKFLVHKAKALQPFLEFFDDAIN